MKIGILTFHWATNYGAILQCYALQTYLESLGHDVKVIDYKPKQYDDTLYAFFRFRKFLNVGNYLENKKKEASLSIFRNQKLKKIQRFYSFKDMSGNLDEFDAIISGSDQVVNPSFLLSGEGRGTEAPTYFLGFDFKGRKIGYALSFGCVEYPQKALPVASKYIKHFDAISVREESGVDIVKSMGRDDAVVVPDPTLLMTPSFYHHLADECPNKNDSYIYSFFIRNVKERKLAINEQLTKKNILWNNEDGDYTMQGWLSKIKNSQFVITDSFHCMVMCLKLHKPFVVVTEKEGNVGMNDRFYTLLEKMLLDKVLINKKNINCFSKFFDEIYNWDKIDDILENYSKIGGTFLSRI
ncbi:MAG: polysaccharide pyruvyl transferase family protein [Bacteroidaceae bacterium]|nr:polysaccharide pyruvyl transferase family protein [Bacteroidaceae bacterium]